MQSLLVIAIYILLLFIFAGICLRYFLARRRLSRWQRHMSRPRESREVAIDTAYQKQLEAARQEYERRKSEALRYNERRLDEQQRDYLEDHPEYRL